MTSILCDAGRWLEHARNARDLSEVISDPEEKQQMLVVAAGFDRIAELAKEQATFIELAGLTALITPPASEAGGEHELRLA